MAGNRQTVRQAARERLGDAIDGALGQRIDHEEADEAIGRVADRVRDRTFVARHARDQRGTRDAVMIERRDPSSSPARWRAGRLPLERLADGFNRRSREAALRVVARQRLEEAPGEEMTVHVVQAHSLYRT